MAASAVGLGQLASLSQRAHPAKFRGRCLRLARSGSGRQAQDAFYRESKNWPLGIAVAFPRFHDIYEQAKAHPSWGSIDDEKGKTFSSTLETALKSGLPLVQICTWNDWGEGTMIEPSREFGFRDLEVVQRLRRQYIEPGFPSRTEDLKLPVRLFKLRKESKQRAIPVLMLDEVARLLSKRRPGAARDRLDAIEREMPPMLDPLFALTDFRSSAKVPHTVGFQAS